GAVRLLEYDAATGAMLLEQCRPGSRLADAVNLDEADEIVAGLLSRLWRSPPRDHHFVTTAEFADELGRRAQIDFERAGEAVEPSFLEHALSLVADLRTMPDRTVILHGDIHHYNVLAAQREAWLAIDPLPRVGD